ncbi:MAG TPA: JAB domain-containing protein [Croceibacterium sp.]|nr:JAB domain-containing protein [Croceibacterium sp.]
MGRIFAASPGALERHLGDEEVAARITAAHSAVLAGIHENVVGGPFNLNDVSIRRYVIGLFKHAPVERLHALFLDGQGRYLNDCMLFEGTPGHLRGTLRPIVSRAIDIGAVGVILMHNHPSGDPRPSDTDVEMTKRLRASLADLELHLVDHLVVAGAAIISMRGSGLI